MAEQAHAHEHEHPNYVKIWGILLALLVVSILGPMIGIKAVTIITAFGIAVVKAYLVAKNFMHVNIEPKYVTYLLTTALAFMGLFFFFVAPDVLNHEGQNWENLAAKKAVAAGGGASGEVAPPPFDAQVAFTGVCVSCHGEKGDGNGPAAASLNPKPANFADPEFWKTRDRDAVIEVITKGGAAVGKSPLMAPYGSAYTPEQIGELADIVMGFRPETPAEPEPAAEGGEPEGEPEGESGGDETGAGDEKPGEPAQGEEKPADDKPADAPAEEKN